MGAPTRKVFLYLHKLIDATYFTDASPEYLMYTSFEEYERKVIKKMSLQELLEETITGIIKKSGIGIIFLELK